MLEDLLPLFGAATQAGGDPVDVPRVHDPSPATLHGSTAIRLRVTVSGAGTTSGASTIPAAAVAPAGHLTGRSTVRAVTTTVRPGTATRISTVAARVTHLGFVADDEDELLLLDLI